MISAQGEEEEANEATDEEKRGEIRGERLVEPRTDQFNQEVSSLKRMQSFRTT